MSTLAKTITTSTPLTTFERANVFRALETGDDTALREILAQHQEVNNETDTPSSAEQHAAAERAQKDLSWFLHFALMYGRTHVAEMVAVLLEFGANPNETATIHGRTALGSALSPPVDLPSVRALIHGGANVNAVGVDGYTPLHLCVLSDLAEGAQILLENGADTHARDRNGCTAGDLARQKDNPSPVDLMLQALSDAEILDGGSPEELEQATDRPDARARICTQRRRTL